MKAAEVAIPAPDEVLEFSLSLDAQQEFLVYISHCSPV